MPQYVEPGKVLCTGKSWWVKFFQFIILSFLFLPTVALADCKAVKLSQSEAEKVDIVGVGSHAHDGKFIYIRDFERDVYKLECGKNGCNNGTVMLFDSRETEIYKCYAGIKPGWGKITKTYKKCNGQQIKDGWWDSLYFGSWNDFVTCPNSYGLTGIEFCEETPDTCSYSRDDVEKIACKINNSEIQYMFIGDIWSSDTISMETVEPVTKTENNVDLVKKWEFFCRKDLVRVARPRICIDEYEVDKKTYKCVKASTNTECGGVGQKECNGKYKYTVCEKDADCKDIKNLPSNAIAGHCVSADRNGYKICTATQCKKNYDVYQGFCKLKVSNECSQKYKTDEAIACCSNPDSVWNENDKKCECSDNKNWVYDMEQKSGTCVKQNHVDEDDKEVDKSTTVEKQDIEQSESDKYTEEEIEQAKKTLKDFFKAAEENTSVWKTESGNFNGTRLASDLTAGVVLGTVGGVVSANVIKKNQIKKGYEVLHCTIGGQIVADWGDEFTVRPGGK